MTFAQSLVMAVPAARQDICNRLMLALGRGPNTFSIPVRDKVTLARVGYLAHSYDDDLADALTTSTLPPGVTLADLQAQGFATAAAARTAAGYIRFKVTANRDAMTNVDIRLAQEGWEREVYVTDMLGNLLTDENGVPIAEGVI